MQQFKKQFSDTSYFNTFSNLQSCLRVNDLLEIGDGSHLLYFNMIGTFSFRQWTVQETIDFWTSFLNKINVKVDYVTIHPDKFDEWSKYYKDVEIRKDVECTWTDGEIGGYCTEFYSNNVEIGNIVNPLGTCIDVGFGLERLNYILTGHIDSKETVLKNSVLKIIESGYLPSNKGPGYVLKKLLRQMVKENIQFDNEIYQSERKRQEVLKIKYERLKERFSHMPKEWWFDTHGIDLDFL